MWSSVPLFILAAAKAHVNKVFQFLSPFFKCSGRGGVRAGIMLLAGLELQSPMWQNWVGIFKVILWSLSWGICKLKNTGQCVANHSGANTRIWPMYGIRCRDMMALSGRVTPWHVGSISYPYFCWWSSIKSAHPFCLSTFHTGKSFHIEISANNKGEWNCHGLLQSHLKQIVQVFLGILVALWDTV